MKTTISTPENPVTIGDLAKRFKVPTWVVRRVADRLFPNLQRAGLYRLIAPDQIDDIESEVRRHLKGGA